MAKNNQLLNDKNLREFGRDYVKILTVFLKKAKKDASGALINSIDYRLESVANEVVIQIEANDYLEWVDKGRKAGKYPPIKEIAKWVRLKGISSDAVFPIARKIFKFGIKPTNVIEKTNKEILTSPTLQKKYEEALVSNIEKVIIDNLNNK